MAKRFGPGRHSTFSRVARTVKRSRRWRGTFQNGVLPSLGGFIVTLLVPSDYEQSPALEPSGVTVAGGPITLCITTDTAVPLSFAYAVGVFDLNETVPPNVDTTTLTDEDILFSGCGVAEQGGPFIKDFKIAVARKLHNDRVMFIIDNNAATAGVLTVTSRLMCLGG